MADYLNLQSMQPGTAWKPNGMLGGYMWNQYQNDYERMLAQTEAGRQMSLDKQRVEQEEFLRGIPLRNQVQDNQLSTAQGEAPYLGQLAASTARRTTAQNESVIGMIPTEERARKNKVDSEQSIEALRKINAANTMAANYLNQALALRNQRGELSMEPQAFLLSRIEELKKAGYNVPENFADPRNWESLYQSAVYDIDTTQKLIAQREKDVEHNWRTKYQADSSLAAANVRASARGSQQRLPRTPDEAVIYYRNIINDPETPEEDKATAMKNYQGAVTSLWQKFESSPANMDIQTLRDRASRATDPAKREEAARAYIAKRNSFFEQYGINAPTPADRARATQQPGTGTVPPPPSGFIVIK